MTPGRETDEVILQVAKDEYKDVLKTDDYDDIAIIYVEALGGGRENIVLIESCITRLRVQLNDISLVDEEKILSTGVSGIVKIGNTHLQLIVGTQVDFIVDSMNDILG